MAFDCQELKGLLTYLLITGGFPFCNFSQAFYTPHQHGVALLEPKTDKMFIVYFAEAHGLVSIRLIHPVLTTYTSKPVKIYIIKF